jgi:hypothetical protein
MPEKGATIIKENNRMSGILLGIVIVKRSFSAAKLRQRGRMRNIAATVMVLIPITRNYVAPR